MESNKVIIINNNYYFAIKHVKCIYNIQYYNILIDVQNRNGKKAYIDAGG